MTQKITPFIWYEKEAREAAKLYTSTFPRSKIKSQSSFNNTPSDTPGGKIDIIDIELMGLGFSLMRAGVHDKLNPAVSFMVHCKTAEEVDKYYSKLSEKGLVMMALDKYPFSARYAFIQDRFGVSWQLMYTENAKESKIVPSLLFVGDNFGNAEEAMKLYTKIFKNSKIDVMEKYKKGEPNGKPGTIKYSSFLLENQRFTAMDGLGNHKFSFNDSISFLVDCKDQEEVDYFWEALSKGGKKVQCGWLKDKFGVSWQIVPQQLNELMSKDKSGRVMQAMLKMVKLDVKELQKAYDGK
ncbi:MAG: VOC family protein [Nanoarchaeota archaeon]